MDGRRFILLALGLALLPSTFVACDGTASKTGTLIVQVRLSATFNTTLINGLDLVLDGAAGATLNLAASAATEHSQGGYRFTTQAKNEDTDLGIEYVASFATNPFTGNSFDFKFTGSWGSAVALAVRCNVLLEGGRRESKSVETTIESSPITLVTGQTTTVRCDVGCTGSSCQGAIDAPVLVSTIPASPANNNTPRVVGSIGDDSMTIQLFADSNCTSTVIGAGSGALLRSTGIPVSVDDNVSVMFYAKATDTSNRTSPCSSSGLAYVEDSTAPSPPSVTATAPTSPANNTAPRVIGVAETFSLVRVYVNNSCDGGVPVTGAAALFADGGITVPVADNAATTFFLTATDDAGNTSACSTGPTYVADSVTAVPTIAGTTPPSPANNNNPRVRGTAEAEATVRIFGNSVCDGGLLASGSATGFTDGGIPITVVDNTATSLSVDYVDRAGNVSPCVASSAPYVEDSANPDGGANVVVAPPGPANNVAPTVSGSAEPSSTVAVFSDSSCTLQIGWGQANDAGLFSFNASVNANQVTLFYLRVTDGVGNQSPCALAWTYVEDSTPPAAPTALATSPASPANDNAPRLLGQAEGLSGIRIYTDSLCDAGAVASGPAATFQFDGGIVVNVSNDTTTVLYLTATDDAGNRSACSSGVTYREDSTGPPAPTGLATTPSGAGQTQMPNLAGSAESLSFVRVFTSSACNGAVIASGTAAAFASPGFFVDAGSNQATTYYVNATDDAGNAGLCSAGTTYVHDTVSPVAPILTATLPVSPNAFRFPRVVGSAEADASILIYIDNACDGGVVGTGGAADLSPVGISSVVAKGATATFYATATDWAGNRSVCSDAGPVYSHIALASGSISTGGNHACALTDAGGVQCWGNNFNGQLGDGTTSDRLTPVFVVGLDGGVRAVSAGDTHSCALLGSGAVRCWGSNWGGQLGDNSVDGSTVPVDVFGLDGGIEAVAAGDNVSCALTADGGLLCWGNNSEGQLGDGTTTMRTTPVNVVGLGAGVSNVSQDQLHTCAVMQSGVALCWGKNYYGELGFGNLDASVTPQPVLGIVDAIGIATGQYHSCAVLASGGAKCWGQDDYGQLGNGPLDGGSLAPVDVEALTSAASVSAGNYGTCASTNSGAAYCWGGNFNGRVGDGTSTDRQSPTLAFALDGGVTTISTSNAFTCARTQQGGTLCWGQNQYNMFMNGRPNPVLTPVDIPLGGATALGFARGSDHACAIVDGGGVKCWGGNDVGQLGNGTTFHSYGAVEVSVDASAVAIGSGSRHVCVLTSVGAVRCWGAGNDGQIGDGTYSNRTIPTDVVGLGSGVERLVVGDRTNCAILSGGDLRCWGWGGNGIIGTGSAGSQFTTPVNPVGMDGGVIFVALGDYYTCAIRDGGAAWCWGMNFDGQCGDGTTTSPRYSPVAVSQADGGLVSLAVSGGSPGHSCALLTNGGVKCWGSNSYGRLGDGTTTQRTSAVFAIDAGVVSVGIGANGRRTCALTTDGGVKCWGYNAQGELGIGTTSFTNPNPVFASGLDGGVLDLWVGKSQACARTDQGTVKCWGYNGNGEVGNGTTTHQTSPVEIAFDAGIARISHAYWPCALTTNGGLKCWSDDAFGAVSTFYSGYPRDVLGFGP